MRMVVIPLFLFVLGVTLIVVRPAPRVPTVLSGDSSMAPGFGAWMAAVAVCFLIAQAFHWVRHGRRK